MLIRTRMCSIECCYRAYPLTVSGPNYPKPPSFLLRGAMLSRYTLLLCVCPSVHPCAHLYVTRRYCTNG